jgi:hypothetical protein
MIRRSFQDDFNARNDSFEGVGLAMGSGGAMTGGNISKRQEPRL